VSKHRKLRLIYSDLVDLLVKLLVVLLWAKT